MIFVVNEGELQLYYCYNIVNCMEQIGLSFEQLGLVE